MKVESILKLVNYINENKSGVFGIADSNSQKLEVGGTQFEIKLNGLGIDLMSADPSIAGTTSLRHLIKTLEIKIDDEIKSYKVIEEREGDRLKSYLIFPEGKKYNQFEIMIVNLLNDYMPSTDEVLCKAIRNSNFIPSMNDVQELRNRL